MTIITTTTSCVPVRDGFVTTNLKSEVALAIAIKNNRFSETESDQLEKIFFASEKGERFFNDPAVQLILLEGLIADTYMDEKVIEAMQTCVPCLLPDDQKNIFDHQFFWLLKNPPIAPNAKIALRFFTDIPSEDLVLAKEICSNPKITPYRPTQYSDQNFNCKINFSESDKLIVCRHLAAQLLLNELNPDNLKISYDHFSSPEDITQHVKSDIEVKYHHIRSSATEAHLIQNANWGQFIANQFEEMEQQGVRTKRMLVESTTHAMAAWLRVKEKDGKKCYVIHFYDPNSTTTHTRAKAYDLANMKHWTLGKFIHIEGEQREQIYYQETQAISMVYVVPESDRFNSPNQQPNQPDLLNQSISHSDRKLTSHNVNLNATTLYHLMASGFAGTLREIVNPIKTLSKSSKDLLNLLNANRVNGNPGLYVALERGHADVIKAYGELLQATGIAGTYLLSLLSAKDADGFPALYVALRNGHADAIKAYGELLTATEISGADLLYLLSAKDANGFSGLYVALHGGHADAIKAYGDLLKVMGISGTDLLNLLIAENANGFSGLYVALELGHADAIRAYGELLNAMGISGADLLNLLNAKPKNGATGLYVALEDGHTDAVLAYCEIISTIAPSLNQVQKTLLLTTLRESHSYNNNDYDFYNQFKKSYPDVYRQFEATKDALET